MAENFPEFLADGIEPPIDGIEAAVDVNKPIIAGGEPPVDGGELSSQKLDEILVFARGHGWSLPLPDLRPAVKRLDSDTPLTMPCLYSDRHLEQNIRALIWGRAVYSPTDRR
jgi:hypothetical protein